MAETDRIIQESVLNDQKPPTRSELIKDCLPWILMAIVVLLTMFGLHWQGRIWRCKWDAAYLLWTSDAWSKHSSQHFSDPYSLTHVLHGLLFYAALNLVFRRRLPFAWLLFFAVLIESGWEILENSKAVIERYRAQTISLDYFGDSVINSFGDILSCALGFYAARKLLFYGSLLLFVLIETVLIFTIRDSLLINIIMLVHPIEQLKTWQTGS